jgi:iron complex outermembrane receptor protein
MIMASPVMIFPISIQAQQLEEIIVTAQRREQSIQEVPISLEAYTGDLLNKEGFRTIEDMSNFSPSVEIDVRTQDQDVSIRGMGTTGNNLGLEAATPIFNDGIHFARTSMAMGAFMDLERVEVLRGPQPIAFGQNATAGAFSLITKKPTAEWEGNVTTEVGNWGRKSVEGGVGGPISDTWGIRLAGQHDRLDNGYVTDIVTGEKFPKGKETAARVTLQWNPTDNFQATLKAEWAQRRKGGDGLALCLTDIGDFRLTERAVIIPGATDFDDIAHVAPLSRNCANGFDRDSALRGGSRPFFRPIQGIDQEDTRGGIVDLTTVAGTIQESNEAHDDSDDYTYRLGLDYEFANGIIATSNTGYIDHQRTTQFDNSSSPIVTNLQHRGQIFDMASQEIRFLSPRGGQIEWEVGAFYQTEDLDLGNLGDPRYQTVTIRANIRRPARAQHAWQDTEWKSGFAALTFNFLDDMASLDVGARYTDVSKQSFIQGFGATWIYDIDPDGPGDLVPGDGIVQGTQHNSDDRIRDVADLTDGDTDVFNCADATIPNLTKQCGSFQGDANFWTHEWQTRTVPDAWDTLSPVAMGPMLWGIRRAKSNDIYFRDYNDSFLDPQVTLRYRPTDNLSLYAKWAKATKGGGADVSTAGLPDNQDAFLLESEKAQNYELGAKGTFLDGAASFNITAFNITIKDLQIATTTPGDLGGGSVSTNAGKQRTRGIEWDSRWAATERLTLGFSGAIMRGKMLSFEGAGCNDLEFELADTGPCISEDESEALIGNDDLEGTIDRSGSDAPRTPDWQFIVDADWWYPITDNLKFMFSGKANYTDGYIVNVEDFNEIEKYNTRIIANFNAGIGSMDDSWTLNFYLRNAFSEGIEYNAENDSVENRIIKTSNMSPRNWASYGVNLTYFWR